MSYDATAFIFENQVVIKNTNVATNPSNGSFVIVGGASIGQNVIVSGDQSIGGQQLINNVNVTPNLNDIIYEQQATLNPSVAVFTDITGFTFTDSVASAFQALITVVVTGPNNYYSLWEINGIYKPTGWAFTRTFSGDVSNVNFQIIESSGMAQVQYTNSNSNAYTTTIRYRAQTTAPVGSSPSGGSGLFNSTSNNYTVNSLLYAPTSDTVASAGDITYTSSVLSLGGSTAFNVTNTTDASSLTEAAVTIAGGAAVAKQLLVGTRVGIATDTPAYPLDVVGDINIQGEIRVNGSIYSGSSVFLASGVSNYYLNPTGGSLGIGTTNPAYSLDVQGEINASVGVIATALTAGGALVTSLTAGSAQISNLVATDATVSNLQATAATIGTLQAANSTMSNLHTTNLTVNNLQASSIMGGSGGITLSNSLIPSADITYDLGSSSARWRDLYLSGNTIHLGDSVTISATTGGSLAFTTVTTGNSSTSFVSISSNNVSTTALTAGSAVVGVVSVGSGVLTNATVGSGVLTAASIGSALITNLTVGNFYVSGTTYTVNETVLNVSETNVTAGTITTTAFTGTSATLGSALISNADLSTFSGGNGVITALSAGSVVASGNIKSVSGTLGPCIQLHSRFTDVTTGSYSSFTSSNTVLFQEDGNPGIDGAIGGASGFGVVSDASDDSITWSTARLIIRGVSLNTGTSGSTITLRTLGIQTTSGTLFTQSSFSVTDSGSNLGFSTWISPWFSTDIVSSSQALALQITSLNGATGGNVRIGNVYLQFA